MRMCAAGGPFASSSYLVGMPLALQSHVASLHAVSRILLALGAAERRHGDGGGCGSLHAQLAGTDCAPGLRQAALPGRDAGARLGWSAPAREEAPARTLTAHARLRQVLREENTLEILEYDEDAAAVRVVGTCAHEAGELWDLALAPGDASLLLTVYNSPSGAPRQHRSTPRRLPCHRRCCAPVPFPALARLQGREIMLLASGAWTRPQGAYPVAWGAKHASRTCSRSWPTRAPVSRR